MYVNSLIFSFLVLLSQLSRHVEEYLHVFFKNKTQHELMKAFTGVQVLLSLHQS